MGVHWDALAFFIEPRSLIFGGSVVIGSLTVEVSGCVVSVGGGVDHVRVVVDHLRSAVGKGIPLHTAYPSEYMDVVMYFLTRLGGVPRTMVRYVNADPRFVPFRAFGDTDVVRNIGYLHGIKQLIINKQLHHHCGKTSYAIHALLRASGYNADEELARRYRADAMQNKAGLIAVKPALNSKRLNY